LFIYHLADILKNNFWSSFAESTDNIWILRMSNASSCSLPN